MVTVSASGEFPPWMKEVSSSSSSRCYSFCSSSDFRKKAVPSWITRAPLLGGAFCLHRMRKTFTRAVCVWRAVCVKVRWICKFYCLPPRSSSSSPIRCVRIGTLTVNFENVVARHRWRILSVNIYALLSEYTYIYTHNIVTQYCTRSQFATSKRYQSKRNQISYIISRIEKE